MKLKFSLRMFIVLLVAGGIYVLGVCGYVLVEAWLFQRSANAAFDETRVGAAPVPPKAGDVMGRLDIQRLGLSVMVLEGTSESELRLAAGHIAGTAIPGTEGNAGISAHRDTYFRPLRKIRDRDEIAFQTRSGTYRYRVVSISIVPPGDAAILAAGDRESLTLVTCYPFYFVGSAPERFVVRAERVN